ncbi:hypothetical protein NDU88_006797 [Pleurodeles waltl]|uniref:Uncharacterized protein n=1 Tax=Pleurodeles waltl TaxID=8319 RepID=A0AAV7QK29_PLEWA|nr:hypothetical protein NDU88_006797 [Pleurodeles waltl]
MPGQCAATTCVKVALFTLARALSLLSDASLIASVRAGLPSPHCSARTPRHRLSISIQVASQVAEHSCCRVAPVALQHFHTSSGARLRLPPLGDSPCWEGAGSAQPRCFTGTQGCHSSSPAAHPYSGLVPSPLRPLQPGAEPPAGLGRHAAPVRRSGCGPSQAGPATSLILGEQIPPYRCFGVLARRRPWVRQGRAHSAPKPPGSGPLVSSL